MYKNLLIFVLFILTSYVNCQNPAITYISSEKVVNIGDTVDLQCSVQYASNYPVIWIKIDQKNPENNLFISTGSSTSIPDNRYSIRHDPSSSTYTLQLSKIQEVDSGLYSCQVVLSASSKVSANTRLIVNIPPMITDNSTRSIITSVGSSIILQCWATGMPTPSLSWRRENNDLLPTGGAVYRGGILILHNVSVADRGTYMCIADNAVGRSAKRNVALEIEFLPIVVAGRNPQMRTSPPLGGDVNPNANSYQQAIGYPVDLECAVESFPLPSAIEWTKDGHRILDDLNHQVSIQSDSHTVMSTRLRINSVQKRHFGTYSCSAGNKLGFAQSQVSLKESFSPVCPPACKAVYSNTSNLKPINLILILCALLILL